MPTPAQIEANRQNAQLSTGPTSQAGLERSSKNATRHGLTGQNLLITPEEKDAYETHCISYVEQYQPKTHEETELLQQYADHQWCLHQINVQLINVTSMLNAATAHHMKIGSDFEVLNAAVAPFYKQLNTLGIYDQRRRRAAEATIARFKELDEARKQALAEAAKIYKSMKEKGQPFNPSEFGFVCSTAEIQAYIARQTALTDPKKPTIQLAR